MGDMSILALSAAFDVINHSNLLEQFLGLQAEGKGTILQYFSSSFVVDSSQCYIIGENVNMYRCKNK